MKEITTRRSDKLRRMLQSNTEYNHIQDDVYNDLHDFFVKEYHKEPERKYTDLFSWYAFPGGYTLYYITGDNGILCAKCANENKDLCNNHNDDQWYIVDYKINDEDHSLYCDNCNEKIYPSLFTEDESDAIERGESED